MKQITAVLLLVLPLCGCGVSASQQQSLNNFAIGFSVAANAYDATASSLPQACANLSATVSVAAATPNLPTSIQNALNNGNNKYGQYCAAGAAVAVATTQLVITINNAIAAINKGVQAMTPTGS